MVEPKTILIVDDEQTMQVMLKVLFEDRGLRVILAGNGTEGLAAIAALGHLPDLILTDVLMPKMDGVAMADQIRVVYPDARIVFMSGDPGKHAARFEGGTELLIKKPFSPIGFANHLQALIG